MDEQWIGHGLNNGLDMDWTNKLGKWIKKLGETTGLPHWI
jgi:hypothetical protein